MCQIYLLETRKLTYTAPPGNVPRHHIAPLTCTVCIDVNVRAQVELPLEVGVSEHRRDNAVWVTIPNFMGCPPPGRCTFAKALWDCCYQALPGNVTQHRRINECMHIITVIEGRWGIKLRHGLGPQLEKEVDVRGRKFCTMINEIS